MSTKANQTIVEFLTAPESLPGVLEVMRHSDAIRRVLLSGFWNSLHGQLRSQLPAELADAQPQWEGVFKPERILEKWVHIDLHPKSSRKQALFYRFEHEAARHYHLYFGITWGSVRPGSTVLARREVKAIKTLLGELNFEIEDNPSSPWLGLKYVKELGSPDDLLAEFIEDRKSVLDDLSKSFLQLVQQTYPFVIEANKSVG